MSDWQHIEINNHGTIVVLRPISDGVASLLVGSICALYLGPFVNPLISPMIGDLAPNGDSNGFASFIVGLGGISIAGLLIDLIRTRTTKVREDRDAQG